MNIKDIAKSYIQYSNEANYNAMADLFAENAEWIPLSPIEPRFGREAIRAGYLHHVKKINKPIINDRYYADGLTCVVEFNVQVNKDELASIVDVFTFNEAGEIIKLAIYKR